MNHLHPRPESERIDWRGSAAYTLCWHCAGRPQP